MQRVADRLKKVKLVKSGRSGWKLTEEGETTAKKLKKGEVEQRIEDRGGSTSTKKFVAVVKDQCCPDVPCIHCHVADGNVFKIKDGRLRKSQGHYEALHEVCAEDFYTGKPSPKTPPPGTQPALNLKPGEVRILGDAPKDAVCKLCKGKHSDNLKLFLIGDGCPSHKPQFLHRECGENYWYEYNQYPDR